MEINKVYCLFEQSGTFKNAFKSLGINAEDYDILNDFGETDHVIDLFSEIDKAYEGKPSLFDNIGALDLVFAFFPCTRFEARVPLSFRCERHGMEAYTNIEKLEYSMKLHEELHRLYMLICKLFVIANRGGWRMIVENPNTQPHYLTTYFPVKPSLIDPDRSANGDYFKKPTQYWFVNCEPEQYMFFEPLEHVEKHTVDQAMKLGIGKNRQVNRSLMHPQYARRFIKSYICERR
jgi:hypothetical protein